ncbi:MAG: GNAT family N-acetyltransferase [Bryobacteraceae bacterium]
MPAASDDALFSLDQFIKAWRMIGTAVPDTVNASEPGLECSFTGLPIAFFNMAFVTPSVSDAGGLRDAASRAGEWAAGQGAPWFLAVTHEVSGEGAELADLGFVPAVKLTGMIADDVAPASRTPEGLDLIAPYDDATSAPLSDINAAAYGIDMGGSDSPMGAYSFWRNHYGAVGMKDNRPVSCTATMMVDGYRYVAFVATLPGERRKGYADAVMRHSLELAAAAHGRVRTVLHATEDGRPVYERMGYRSVSTHSLFIEARFLEGH